MFYTAKNLLVKINNKDISANEASLTYEASVEPFFTIGDQYTQRVTPTNLIQGALNINYYYTGEDILHSLKSINSGLFFDFGGIKQTGYLRSHSVRFSPHTPINCNAQIVFYRTPIGNYNPIFNNISVEDKIIHADELEINTFDNSLITGHYTSATLNYSADIRPEFHIEDTEERRGVFGRKETTFNGTINNLNPELLVSGNKAAISFILKKFGENSISSAYNVTGHLLSKNFRANIDENITTEIIIKQYELLEESKISGIFPSNAGIGELLTISGSNLLNVLRVYFDDFEVSSFSILNNNTIQLEVPRLKSPFPKISLLTSA